MTSVQKDITQQYSLGIINFRFEYRQTKGNLLENLEKYMIKSPKSSPEDLSSHIDELLYGKI